MAKIMYKPGRVELETPFVQMFVDDIRTVPYNFRSWVPERRVWIVWSPHIDRAVQMVKTYFPDAEEVGVRSGEGYDWTKQEQERKDNERKERERQEAYEQSRNRTNWKDYQYRGYGSGSPSGSPRTSSDHETLYLTPEAPEQVVKAAYRALAVMYHPDRSASPDATAKMQTINAAYDRIKKGKGWT